VLSSTMKRAQAGAKLVAGFNQFERIFAGFTGRARKTSTSSSSILNAACSAWRGPRKIFAKGVNGFSRKAPSQIHRQ
jgi:hypothetical protein